VERIMHKVQPVDAALEQAEKTVNHELHKALEYDEYIRSKMDFFNR